MLVYGSLSFIINLILIVGILKEIRGILIAFLTLVAVGLVLNFVSFFNVEGGSPFAFIVISIFIKLYGFIVVYSFQCEVQSRANNSVDISTEQQQTPANTR